MTDYWKLFETVGQIQSRPVTYPEPESVREIYWRLKAERLEREHANGWRWQRVELAVDWGDCDAMREAGGDQTILMPHRTLPEFMDGMRWCAQYARRYLGPDISGLGSSYYAVAAGLSTHTDNDYVQALPGTFLSVWVALADVTERNGPLVIDGRAILCRKGDALIFDGDLPHRSCAGEGPRPVALFTYIKRGMPFRPGAQQKRKEVPV